MVWTALGGLPTRAWLATLGVGLAAAATWYLLPVVSGDHGDVAVYGGGTIESSIDELSYQLRDRGRDVTWIAAGSTWCELAELEPAVDDVDVIVLAPEALGTCDGDPVATTLDALPGDFDIVLVALGNAAEATSRAATGGVSVVDPTALLGAMAPQRCRANGGTIARARLRCAVTTGTSPPLAESESPEWFQPPSVESNSQVTRRRGSNALSDHAY